MLHQRSLLGNAAVTAVMSRPPELAPSSWAGQMMLAGQNMVGNQAVAAGAVTMPPVATPVEGPKKPEPAKPKPGEPRPKAVPPPAAKPEVKDQKKDKPETPEKQEKKPEAGAARSPAADPKFQALKKDVNAKKRKVGTSHPPPAVEAGAAQAASVPPADDREARGKAAHAEDMETAEPKAFDKQAFVEAVKKAIEDRSPKNLEQADQFGESGKAEEVKAEVQGKVGEGKDASAKEIADKTAETPQPAPDAKEVVPMAPDQVPGKPGAPNPNQAAPDALPASATDMSAGPEQVNDQMSAAQVTEKQLSFENSREPAFGKAVQDKKAMEEHSAEAPGELRKGEAKEIKQVKTTAAAKGSSAMTGIHATRVATGKKVGTGKEGAKGRDEEKRTQVTTILQKVFDKTKFDVEKILSDLDKEVDRQFTDGEKRARERFTREHTEGMRRYKAERYGGWDGGFLWAKDKLFDLPDEANKIYLDAKKNYLAAMDLLITDIAGTVERELNRAKERITTGRKDLKEAVDKLPKDLQEIGREAATDFEGKFDELKDTVNDKGSALVDTLATKYTDAVKSVDEEIAREKEKNKGLVTKAAEAIGDVIETIKELGRLLLNVLRKAASAIGLILKDPIGFLDRLISGVGGGLKLFGKNAGKHLEQGVLAWLLGAGVTAGLQLPATFDILGILLMIAALLGISWPNIRSKLVRRVPEQAVLAAETAVPVVSQVKRRGVAGMWDDLKTRVGDLKKELISKLAGYLLPTIILAGITWIVSLFNPASAFIRACKMIIDIVKFIVTQARQIYDFVNAVLDAVIAIARGGGGIPGLIERALARSIPVLIGALAAILGVGGIAGKVRQIFQQISRPVTRAIDAVVNKMADLVKKLWAKIKPKPKPKTKPKPDKDKDKPKKPKDKDKPARPKKPRRPARPKRPRKPEKPKVRKPKDQKPRDRKRKDRRSEQEKKRALAAALKDANELIGDPAATVKSVRKGLPGIKRTHRLTSIRLVKSGELYHIRLAINPADDSQSQALNFSFTETGKHIVKDVHESWWKNILSKAKLGDDKPVWSESVLNGTEKAAMKYIEGQDVAAFRKEHPRAVADKGVARKYLFGTASATREPILEKLGGDEGALPKLKSAGRKTAAGDEKTTNIIDEMVFNADRQPFGRWDPFPSREADADKELVAAIKGAGGLRGFLEKMVKHSIVGTITWEKFEDLWKNDTPSREFVKNRYRDLVEGMHEWIPTDYLIEVVKAGIERTNEDRIKYGLDWLRLQDALRSPTNYVIFRVLNAEGLVSLGAHVGTFYTAERKSTLTSGTKEFHDGLRRLYKQHQSGTAQAYIEHLLGILASDRKAGPSGFKLVWSGDLGDLPPHVVNQPIGALFRAGTGDLRQLTLLQLSVQQQSAFDAVELDFRSAKAKLKG